jgi:WS/DGAT/MGAT family acyltransferase
MSKEAHLNQLADGDAVFLSTETATAWGHVGGLSVLDASDVPDFGYEKLLRSVSERLELVPRFKWKLKEVPLALDRPYWVECPEFELRNHVHRIALPAPGGPKELGELAGLLFSHPLDRSRPLWEMWLIEGLEGGKHAMFMKSHHCLMDGQAGAGLAEVLTDLTPDATAPPMVPEALVEGTPKTPSDFEVMMRAARHTVERRRKLAGHAVDAVREFVWKPWTTTRDEFTPPTWNDVPRTRFNGPVSVRRQLAFASLDLEPLKAIKKHFDVTLNDVVLELIGGALRRWLRGKGELPEQPLVAFCPVSLRSADDKSLGNQVTMMPVSMATDLDDPAERLRRIAKNSARSKECLAEGSFDVLMAMAESFAPAVVSCPGIWRCRTSAEPRCRSTPRERASSRCIRCRCSRPVRV